MKLHLDITDNDMKLIGGYALGHNVNLGNFNSIKLIVLFNKLPKTRKLAIHHMYVEEIVTLGIYYMLNLISLEDAKRAFIRYEEVVPKYNSNV